MVDPTQITRLLREWQNGDRAAEQQLVDLVRGDLREMVHRQLRKQENRNLTFQTTELFHELYIRLTKQNNQIEWEDRGQFFAFSSRLLRQVLVDAFRNKRAQKRGSGLPNLVFEPNLIVHRHQKVDFCRLNDALEDFEKIDPIKSKVVEMRFFGGMTEREIAEAMKLSVPTIKRYWRMARIWLLSYLASNDAEPESGFIEDPDPGDR